MRRPSPVFWAYLLGSGLALSPIHNQRITDLATNSRGEVVFFLPAFGWLLVIMGAGMFLLLEWDAVKKAGLGNRCIVIPMLVIVGAIGLSGITRPGIQDKVAPLGMGLSLFAVYLASRILGKQVFFPLAVGAAVASLGAILYQLWHPGTVTGGYVFEGNYDIIAGYVLLGSSLFIHRWRWLLAGLSLLAMLATGSPEALFTLAVSGVIVLVRRDWSWKLASFGLAALLFLGFWFALGHGQQLYSYAIGAIGDKQSTAAVGGVDTGREPMGYRLGQIGKAMTSIKPLGNGYSVTEFRTGIVHNVPLIMVQQLGWPGALAGLAWLWVTIYCLVKTKWKYAWALVLSLSVFDHYVWTQLAPLWWAVAGASLASTDDDRIFRRKDVRASGEQPFGILPDAKEAD